MTDELLFDVSELYKYGRALLETKRSVHKLTAKIFDQIGFLIPFTIEMKIVSKTLSQHRWLGSWIARRLTQVLDNSDVLAAYEFLVISNQLQWNASYIVFLTPLLERTPLLFILKLFIPMEELVFFCPTCKQIPHNCIPIENLQLDRFNDRPMLDK